MMGVNVGTPNALAQSTRTTEEKCDVLKLRRLG